MVAATPEMKIAQLEAKIAAEKAEIKKLKQEASTVTVS
jgi:cell division protein FtsB